MLKRKLIPYLRSQGGFSVVEGVVAVGLLGVVMTVFMNMTVSQKEGVANISSKVDELELYRQMYKSLEVPAICDLSLQNKTAGENLTSIGSASSTQYPLFAVNQNYGKTGDVRITNLQLQQYMGQNLPVNGEGMVNVVVTMQRIRKAQGQDQIASNFSRAMRVKVFTNPSRRIVRCVSSFEGQQESSLEEFCIMLGGTLNNGVSPAQCNLNSNPPVNNQNAVPQSYVDNYTFNTFNLAVNCSGAGELLRGFDSNGRPVCAVPTAGSSTSTASAPTAKPTPTPTPTPSCSGAEYQGYCWYETPNAGLNASQSCDELCSSRGGCNAAGTINFAGSGGNMLNCLNVSYAIRKIPPVAAIPPSLTFGGSRPGSPCGTLGDPFEICSHAIVTQPGNYGCGAGIGTAGASWANTGATTCAAKAPPLLGRYCACNK